MRSTLLKFCSRLIAAVLVASAVFSARLGSADQLTSFSFVFPLLSPRLSSNYGVRKHPIYRSFKHHNGVDLAAPKNSHVRAVAPGRVVFADRLAGYGKLVSVQHLGGYTSFYGHLNDIQVELGQPVRAGELIGLVGSTGTATGYHLHFEWRKNGVPLNPLKAFPELTAEAKG